MKNQKKNTLWVGIIILLLSACGPLVTPPTPTGTPVPTAISTESPTNTPEIASTESAEPEQIGKYVGMSFPPFPEDLSQGFSMIIQNSGDFGLSLVSDGANNMLWLTRLTHYDTSGTAFWEVLDVLDLTNVEPGAILIPDGCSLNGQPDSEIFVAGQNGSTQFAWRANTTLNAFEVISTNGIECNSDKAIRLD